MPELPEVEEVRRTLEPGLLGQSLGRLEVLRADIWSPQALAATALQGLHVTATRRHGKKLFWMLSDQRVLLFHLGMSGRLIWAEAHQPLAPHTHTIFHLATTRQVRFQDPRRFGGIWHYPDWEHARREQIDGKLGPDALSLQESDLAHWSGATGQIKARLLSQRDVAGLGNIYVDEALWLADLHPLTPVSKIPASRRVVLVQAIKELLNRSIQAGGTTLRDYRNAADAPGWFAQQLRVYGRGGKPCLRCQTRLTLLRIAGRTSVFCPLCQKLRTRRT